MAEYQAAGTMLHAEGPSLKTADFGTPLPLHQDLRRLAEFAESEAELYERQGELDQAWACHLATLRSANHADKPGLLMCCFIGNSIRARALEGIAKWTCHPLLTAEQLKSARKDLVETLAGRFQTSDCAKAQYLATRNTLRIFDVSNVMSLRQLATNPVAVFYQGSFWCLGEPELTFRLERQQLANTVPELGKPRYARPPLRQSSRLIFEDRPNHSRASGQLDSADFVIVGDRTFRSPVFPRLPALDPAIDSWCLRAQAREAIMPVLFATQEYYRHHSEIPKSLEQLVPHYLPEVPLDPMDPKGSPICFRIDSDGTAVIWSVGENAVDDAGVVEGKSPTDIGYRFQIRPSGVAQEEPAIAEELSR